jgi:high frequency lysogenization protein
LTIHDRTLALAGLMQAVQLVQQMARTGEADAQALAASIESLFRFDAGSAEDVFGGAARLEPGLHRLLSQLEGDGRDPALTRMAMTVLHLERRFVAHPGAAAAVHAGLREIDRQREHFGAAHPTVLSRLGELYASRLSAIGPRVLVQGNPVYLARTSPTTSGRAR